MSHDWRSTTLTKRSLVVTSVIISCVIVFTLGGGAVYRGPTSTYMNTKTQPFFTMSERSTPVYPVTETGQTTYSVTRTRQTDPVFPVGVHLETGGTPANHSVNVSMSELNQHTANNENFPDSYLGIASIREQFSANTHNFIQLVYMSMLWNLSVMEPAVNELGQLSSISSSSKHIPFGYVFNMTAVAKKVQNCFHMPRNFYFHSLNEALIHSSRDVLVLQFMLSDMSVELEECSDKSESAIKGVMKALNSQVEKVKEQAKEIHGDEYIFRPLESHLCKGNS